MKKGLIILYLLSTSLTAAFSQDVRIVVSDRPLNTVLHSLNVEISFDDKALSNYRVSLSSTFKTAEEAIRYLLKDTPFKVEKIGRVFVISPLAEVAGKPDSVVERQYIVSGELTDRTTGEPLPYAHLQTGRGTAVTNESGLFTLVQDTRQALRIQLHYIGFETLDTVLAVGKHHLSLQPRSITLDEITLRPSSPSMLMQSGKSSGEMRINHQIARYLPGSVDNSVFSLLRMLPGVRASGEPSDDLIVWGSNWGESQLVYDGFTIFGMKSFNDQIGSVNPYMAKDIRLLKGGYDASWGNRTGAIAEITGNEGNFDRPSVKANLSNYTANLFASLPVKKTSALSLAYRQTFYNLYDRQTGESGAGHGRQLSSGVAISPEYAFRDLNLKYAGKVSDRDRYYVSLYGADDRFKFSVEQQTYTVEATEKSRQYGAATGYNRVWDNGSSSRFLFSFSQFSGAVDHVSGITGKQSAPLDIFHIDHSVQELSLLLEHHFNLGRRQQLQAGGKWQQYAAGYNGHTDRIHYPSLYVTDHILLGKLSLQAGVRVDGVLHGNVYLQPRLSARYAFTEEWTASASFGLYNQFLTRIPYQYLEGSYQMTWALSDEAFLSSLQTLAGVAYSKNGWLFSAEGYVKSNRNERFYVDNAVQAFDNTLWGLDFYGKKEGRRHTVFGSYSIVNARMPQATRGHEVKLAAIHAFGAFRVSAMYVYGAGFDYLSTGGHGHGMGKGSGSQRSNGSAAVSTEPYSRFDLSLIYRLQSKHCSMQAGASVLNVFDTNNIKYSYRLSDQNNVINIYTKATPFTPMVFVEIIF